MIEAPEQIPTIDISPWLIEGSSERDKQHVVDQMHHAATTYGFFQAVGHGVSSETRQEIFDVTKRFFSLPLEDRMEVSIHKSIGQAFRGYEPSLLQTHRAGLLPDTKEVESSNFLVP